MKAITYGLLLTVASAMPLCGMDSADPLSSLPLSGKSSSDHKEKVDRWDRILDLTHRSGKHFKREDITLRDDLTAILKEVGWDSKLSVPQALQKFYELLTPEYVVAKIRERMIRYGQGTAGELTDEFLAAELIRLKIFEALQATSLPG